MKRLSTWGTGSGAPVEAIGGGESARGVLPAIDVHQHLWPEELLAALRARRTPPQLRGWRLELDGEPDYLIDPISHDVAARAAQAAEDGVDLALVSLSSPLGIETLPSEEAAELLAAYHDGVLALPAPFGAWAAACLTEIDPAAVARELARGFAGLQLPATALLDAAGYDRVGPLLEVLAAADKPLLIHPGPAGGGAVGPAAGGAVALAEGAGPRAAGAAEPPPPWWPALVPYVQQMHAAWFAFRAYGRPRHPSLRVCFAILAGLGPLHGERFVARAGARNPVDPGVFVEVSSYGTRAVDATIRVLGIDALVNGSDRPYAEPAHLELGAAALHALRTHNTQRLLNPKGVLNDLAVAACA
jgi:6-methylsalicylate decarboxylase